MGAIVGKSRQSLLTGLQLGILAGVIFAAGFAARGALDHPTIGASPSIGRINYELLAEVQQLLDTYYLRQQPDARTQEYAAIRGVLSSLSDRYTFLIDPPVAQSESDVLAGAYGGIGVKLQRAENGEVILYPFVNSPAQKAGISDGNVLLAINDNPVDLSAQPDELDQMIRGEVKGGNGVKLMFRTDAGDIKEKFVEFGVVNVPSVMWRMVTDQPGIGYMQIGLITSRTPDELVKGLLELRTSGAQALVIDLRSNSGGLLQESVEVANQFLREGLVIVYEESSTAERVVLASPGGLALDWPLVILVNEATASAAELIAGALRDHARGVILGQKTYGKGTVQQIFRLSDDSSLHVTASEWLTPSRTSLDGIGLKPDIVMIPDTAGREIELGEAIRVLEDQLQK